MVRATISLLRTPLIKFKKGGFGGGPAHPSSPSTAAAAPAAGTSAGSRGPTVSAAVIEDFMVPARYQRRPLSNEEIACINAGGAI